MKRILFIFCMLNFCSATAQEIIWQHTIGGNRYDYLKSMDLTLDGGVILGGTSNSPISGDKTEGVIGGGIATTDYWIVRINKDGNILWEETIGGTLYDDLTSIISTSDGGFLAGGSSNSEISGDKTEGTVGNNASNDYWIVKIDSIGNVIWENTIGGDARDELDELLETPDGGFILAGNSNSWISGDKTAGLKGGYDYWIIKTNSLGVIEWQQTYGGSNNETFTSITPTNEGGYMLGGYSSSPISVDKSENSKGFNDYWIVKIDSVGNIIWEKTIGGANEDWLYDLIQTYDGGYLLAGHSISGVSGDKTSAGPNGWNYWIVKIDTNGNIMWQNTIGGSKRDDIRSVRQFPDGGYILVGQSDSHLSGHKSENNNGQFHRDVWVVRLDESGNIIWQNTIGGNWDELVTVDAIVETPDGGLVIGSSSDSEISGDKTETYINAPNWRYHDFWVFKIYNGSSFINGNVFTDLNQNLTHDSTENVVQSHRIFDQNSNRFCFTRSNGNYNLLVNDTGDFNITPNYRNYYDPIPTAHHISFNSYLQVDSLNDFAFQPNGSFNDLCVTITPSSSFRSGFNATYTINYYNFGTVNSNAQVVFYPDQHVSFDSSVPAPDFVSTDSILYNLGLLSPNQTGEIFINVKINTGLPIGSLVNSGTAIYPKIGDANLICNEDYWEVFTTGSYDPNDIRVNRQVINDYELVELPELEYIIRFQNTGNDTAFTVKILNPVDTNSLDINSLRIIGASHPMDAQFIYHEKNLEFLFNEILLPDSNINEPKSHGFVRFAIKPKQGLQIGDAIKSWAAIYFDFNEPIITNEANTTVIYCVYDLGTISVSTCQPFTSPDGQTTWNSSGNYDYTYYNSDGCDSLVSYDLTIYDLDNIVIVQNEKLTTSAGPGQYQWLDCANSFAEIKNATNQEYVPVRNGLYAMKFSDTFCTDTSNCVKFLKHQGNYYLYPTYEDNEYILTVSNQKGVNLSIKLFDTSGKLVKQLFNDTPTGDFMNIYFNMNSLIPGVYYIQAVGKDNDIIKFLKL